MPARLLSWASRRTGGFRPARRPGRGRLAVEPLEGRSLLSGSPLDGARPLVFDAFDVARVSEFLASSGEVDLHRVTLQSGDLLHVQMEAQSEGSGLASLLRVFDASGTPLALNNQQGGDPQLSFQALTTGTYFLGVSSAPNFDYDPTVATGGSPLGGTTGRYTLAVRRSDVRPLLPDLTGSSFRLGRDVSAVGDLVPVAFAVENRGGADPGNFQVQVVLSDSNLLGGSSQVLATLGRADLLADVTGRRFSTPAGFSVMVPAGWMSGPVFVGTRILADGSHPESDSSNNSGVHRGLDWAPLTVVSRVPSGVTDLSSVDAALNTGATGSLLNPGQSAVYSLTVASALGEGRLTVRVGAVSGTLLPRLVLSGPNGEMLLQSDHGEIVQHLDPGTYLLSVSARSGSGTFDLATTFVRTSQPFAPLPSGAGTCSVAVADFDNDGYLDFVIADRLDLTVSVFLGNGDGTFQQRRTFACGPRSWRINVGDVDADGNVDILVGNKGDNTVSILLGNGDGTFQDQLVVPAGIRVGGAVVAELNGDGIPDLLVDNYAEDTIWVLLGLGNGTFQPPAVYPTDENGNFQGPCVARAADVSGDGIPDLIYSTYIGEKVVVRLGNGDGTFGPEQKFAGNPGCYEPFAVDLDGDGKLDLVAVNSVDDTVSVLLNQGGWEDGTGSFQDQRLYPVGANPYAMTMADVNGDGRPDFITSNRDDNTVSVLLGNGDGTFQPQKVFLAGKTTRRVAAGDFNGDGRVDLVTSNQGDNTATVLLGNGDGTFVSSQESAPAPDVRPFQVVVADLNGDGRPDLATANRADNSVGVQLSNPDGSFQSKESFAVDRQPFGITAADLDGDGILDLATANYAGGSVSILLGNGDGTFQPHQDLTAGSNAYGVRVDDVNADGFLDVLCTNKNDNNVGVFLGNGNGTFQAMATYPVANGPYELVIHDLDGNGALDVVVSHFSATVVDVLLGNGDGTFQPTRQFRVGSRPYGLAVADLDGDGKPDIATSNYRSSDASVLLGNGDGTFGPPQLFPTGSAPNEVQVGDLDGDGVRDLVTANYGSDDVSVLLGNGDGTFRPQQTFSAGSGPATVAIEDLDGDGVPDLVVGNRNASTVQVLRGNGDGTFRTPVPFGVGKNRYSVAVAELNGDGKPDLVTTRLLQNDVTVQLGTGTGTFEPGRAVPVGAAPTSVALADLNRDGRSDMVTTNSNANTLSVLLGNGNGTFGSPQTFAVGRSPRSVQVADVDGDGIPDLSVANYHDGTLSVLLGSGDGAFQAQRTFPVGRKPYSLSVVDLDGDGNADLVSANSADGSLSVLLGNGDGSFQSQQTQATGRQPFRLAVRDVNGDGRPDLVSADAFDDTVSVRLGNGDGNFGIRRTFAVGARPYSVEVQDVNGDGRADLVTTNYRDDTVSVLLGIGDGTFSSHQTFASERLPVLSLVADVNADGRPDLVTVGNQDRAASVLLGKGDGSFQETSAATGVGLRSTPILADLDGDGIRDRVVLDRSGKILFRRGLAGGANVFAPPVALDPGRAALAIALVDTGSGLAIAAAEARFDATLSSSQFVYAVSLYTVGGAGAVTRGVAFATTELPARLASTDLTGDGLDELITANALDESVTIVVQIAPGQFGTPLTVAAGIAPSDIALADVDGDGRTDVLVSNQASGDVTILLGDASHSFSRTLRFRAAAGLFGMLTIAGRPAVASLTQAVSLTAGDFTGDGRVDLVVVNRGTHAFTVLAGNGTGGFDEPLLARTTSTSDGFRVNQLPGAIASGDFDRNGTLDLAVLMEDSGQVWIYSGRGDGTFRHGASIPVGDQATGLDIVPGSAPGLLDLLVGNGFGDVLHLEGKGDGTFQIRGKRVSLSIIPDLFGPGQAGVLVGNQQDNRVTVQAPTSEGNQFTPVETLAGGSSSEQLAPGDVQWSMLSRQRTLPDAVVVSTGSNAVIVYRTIAVTNGVPSFASQPRTYFVGTAPASLTVADVNGDGVPDMLIANPGSNDVSVLFGSHDADGAWVGIPGPRLRSGGAGPIAVTVRPMNADANSDLVVTNGGSGTLTVLSGVGQGFFDDQDPRLLLDLGDAVVQTPTFAPNSAVGYAVTAGGDLLRFDLDDPGKGVGVAFSGRDVLAARALTGGLVVVALQGGIVQVLSDQNGVLSLAAQLQAQGGVPVLPSALEVIQTRSGGFQVLVSSQGSDNVFVFAQVLAVAPPTGGLPTPGAGSVPTVGGAVPVGTALQIPFTPIQFLVNGTSGSGTSSRAGGEGSSATGSQGTAGVAVATVVVGATAGLASGSLGTVENTPGGTGSGVSLVAMQGNTYATVAMLDSGGTQDDESGDGRGRQPWLATRLPLGDSSPLTRLVIGQDDGLHSYREAEQPWLPTEGAAPTLDPWLEDLFHNQQPPRPSGGSPEYPLESREPEEVWESGFEAPEVKFEAMTLLLAGMLLAGKEAERVSAPR